jgi:hypothetical protein
MNSSADSAAERAMEYMELRRRIQELRIVEADLVEANKGITRLKGALSRAEKSKTRRFKTGTDQG